MKNSTRIGVTLVFVLTCIVSFALPVEAREPRPQERGAGSYQADHTRKNTASQETRHQERAVGSYQADRDKQYAAPSRETRPQDKHYVRPHHAPSRHVPVVVRNQRYFYLDGLFYRQGLYGYISVQAPFGAVILSLPIGYSSVVVGGTRYYVYGGIYYRHVPTGYEVVKRPYLGDRYCTPEIACEIADQVVVTTAALNVRQGPGKTHPVIYQVYRHDILKIIGRATGWFYVSLPSGVCGWVMAEFVSPLVPSARG